MSIKEQILNYKWVILTFALISGLVILVSMPQSGKQTMTKATQAMVKADLKTDENVTLNGEAWNNIDQLEIPIPEKLILKSSILKVILETTMLNGKPLITPSGTLTEYIAEIDNLFSSEEDAKIPVFFALKIADLKKNGAPEAAVNNYKNTVVQKLKSAGLIK